MTTNIKLTAFARSALGAAALLSISPALGASDPSGDIIVRQDVAMSSWQAQTTVELERALRVGRNARGTPNNSIVQVTFALDRNGKAQDLAFLNGEGNWFARSIARRAVARLENLGSVPVADPQAARFIANIIFAHDRRNHARLEGQLVKMEAERLASTTSARTYIALGN